MGVKQDYKYWKRRLKMGDRSGIQWTDATWNPLAGCTRKSPGCDNCYAAAQSLRLEAMAKIDLAAGIDPGGKAKYIGVAANNKKGIAAFTGIINVDYGALNLPFRWKRPRKIFTNSMSDLFHPGVPVEFARSVCDVMERANWHTFQVLTKRPENILAMVPEKWRTLWPNNVWIGTSVENQEMAEARIPYLLQVPAAVRFLSCEPLLGEVDLSHLEDPWHKDQFGHHFEYDSLSGSDEEMLFTSDGKPLGYINWVIVGGESGPNARPFHVEWARKIVKDATYDGRAIFVKQLGDNPHIDNKHLVLGYKGQLLEEWPEDLRIQDFPIPNRNPASDIWYGTGAAPSAFPGLSKIIMSGGEGE